MNKFYPGQKVSLKKDGEKVPAVVVCVWFTDDKFRYEIRITKQGTPSLDKNWTIFEDKLEERK